MIRPLLARMLAMLALAPAAASAQQDVTFQINYNQTTVGQSVFVLGDVPELGASDVRKAIKLEPTDWPIWRTTIRIPAGISYSYRFIRRDDGPGRLGDTTNQVSISGPFNASTPASPAPLTKAILVNSSFAPPTLMWRTLSPTPGPFIAAPMQPIGQGRSQSEQRWIALGVGAGQKPIEFYFTSGSSRDPAAGNYSTSLDGIFVQDGQVFSYAPAPAITDWRRDYNPGALPAIQSQFLFENSQREWREYRVILPRGYDQHPTRRYPVVYLHDGQNVFESGPFGTWNAHTAAGSLIRQGQMREAILVGVDNGPNRLSDYSAPDAGGNAANYVRFLREELMPLINSRYRTLTGPDDTIAIGSSMGGQVSLYMGWDYSTTFGRIGAFSGAWSVFTSGFYDRVRMQAKRPIILYIDSGDAGAANDNYWPTFNLRDNLLDPQRAGSAGGAFVLENNLKHVIGLGQQHNEAAWASRLPDAYRFLLPPSTDQSLLLLANGSAFDLTGDGQLGIDDLYEQLATPRDVNLDGQITPDDAALLEWAIRRGEPADVATPQRP
ncbi:MAG: hypothetical protein K2W85_15205 [Phycisphaerales bacterium]|nr:hypothetical protein [Phycisphaerales bacterium]